MCSCGICFFIKKMNLFTLPLMIVLLCYMFIFGQLNFGCYCTVLGPIWSWPGNMLKTLTCAVQFCLLCELLFFIYSNEYGFCMNRRKNGVNVLIYAKLAGTKILEIYFFIKVSSVFQRTILVKVKNTQHLVNFHWYFLHFH